MCGVRVLRKGFCAAKLSMAEDLAGVMRTMRFKQRGESVRASLIDARDVLTCVKADYHALAAILRQTIIEKQPVEWVARQCARRLSVDASKFLSFVG